MSVLARLRCSLPVCGVGDRSRGDTAALADQRPGLLKQKIRTLRLLSAHDFQRRDLDGRLAELLTNDGRPPADPDGEIHQ